MMKILMVLLVFCQSILLTMGSVQGKQIKKVRKTAARCLSRLGC